MLVIEFIKDVIKLLTGLVSVGGRGGTEEALARMIMTLYSAPAPTVLSKVVTQL